MPGESRGRRGRRRAFEQPGAPPGGAQGSRGARHRAVPAGEAALRRSRRARHARPFRGPAAARAGARARVAAQGPRMRPLGAAATAARPARRTVAGHGGGPRHVADHRGLAGISRDGVRPRRRRGLDHDRGAPLRSRERRSRGFRRAHEPADPLRRRPHEPRLVLDDEPGRRCADDGGRARGLERAGR